MTWLLTSVCSILPPPLPQPDLELPIYLYIYRKYTHTYKHTRNIMSHIHIPKLHTHIIFGERMVWYEEVLDRGIQCDLFSAVHILR